MNVDLYLQRIGYTGELHPTLSVLRQLQTHHLLSIPFENLDIHYGVRITLDAAKFYEKIITRKRGGFCYELNGLYFELLRSLGYKVKMVSARVFDSKTDSYGQEYDHLAIIAELPEGEYLTDVGFGEFAFAPLRITLNTRQEDDRGQFIIDRSDTGALRVSKSVDGTLFPQYLFSTDSRELKSFAGMCLFHQTSPESHFTQKRMISIATARGRITIVGDQFKITEDDSVVLKYTLRDEADFAAHLLKYFGIDVLEI